MGCVGYEFFCCPAGERCFGGGSVLFSKNTRPSGTPPGTFSTSGPFGAPTVGGNLIGSGPILSMNANTGPDGSCYAKHAVAAGALQTSKKVSAPAAVQQLAAVQLPPPHAAARREFVVTSDYTLIGHGRCLDGAQQSYEYWYLPAGEASGLLYVNGDPSTCACKACQDVCDQHMGCVGYEFFCCPAGERCFGGGSVLFSKNTRPSGTPPGTFSTSGPFGAPTVGGNLIGSGPILSMNANTGPDGSCYAKHAVRRLGPFITSHDAPQPLPVVPDSPALRR